MELEEMLLDLYEFYKEEQTDFKTVEKRTGLLKAYAWYETRRIVKNSQSARLCFYKTWKQE